MYATGVTSSKKRKQVILYITGDKFCDRSISIHTTIVFYNVRILEDSISSQAEKCVLNKSWCFRVVFPLLFLLAKQLERKEKSYNY